MNKYIALLRGINVGGHRKVPMADLKKMMESLGFLKIITLLNSGNIIFESNSETEQNLEKNIDDNLEKTFGFPVPVLVRTGQDLLKMKEADLFSEINETNDTRLYVSFIKCSPAHTPGLPFETEDKSFRILSESGRAVFSVLDLSLSGSIKAMEQLEKIYG